MKSATRVFEIFECVAQVRHGLALKDIMARLGAAGAVSGETGASLPDA